jgi:hypothetical protein
MRVRLDAEVAGDLGRASHGFEEARALTDDPGVARDAKSALATRRTEVARRRAKADESIEVDPEVQFADGLRQGLELLAVPLKYLPVSE